MSDNRIDHKDILDKIADEIEADDGFSYADLPSLVWKWGGDCNRAGQSLISRHRQEDIDQWKASLPEPDATNPEHLRWAAEMIEIFSAWKNLSVRARQRNVLADELRNEADRLDAARSAEREREQRIEQAARAVFGTVHFDDELVTLDLLRVAARALDAAGLLRGGGRGE